MSRRQRNQWLHGRGAAWHPNLGAPDRQRGIAIIMSMLVIALGSITMVAIASRQQLELRREQNESLIQQARSFGISGERFAAALLFRDADDALRSGSDSLDDDWAQTIPPVPIDNAAIKGCIVDMQGRFNLNNLVNPAGQAVPIYVDQLKRLLTVLGIDVTKADAIVDWVDADVNATVPNGAEDDYYTGLDPAYRAANRPFTSVSELSLVQGFSSVVEEEREDYELLLPHIAALPTVNGPTAINVNTATPEVLSSFSDFMIPLGTEMTRWDTLAYEDYPECEDLFDLSEDNAVESLSGDARDTTPFESTLLFETEAGVGTGENLADIEYGVKSSWFQVRIDIATEALTLSQFTLFQRGEDGKTRVVLRSRDTL